MVLRRTTGTDATMAGGASIPNRRRGNRQQIRRGCKRIVSDEHRHRVEGFSARRTGDATRPEGMPSESAGRHGSNATGQTIVCTVDNIAPLQQTKGVQGKGRMLI